MKKIVRLVSLRINWKEKWKGRGNWWKLEKGGFGMNAVRNCLEK